MAYHANLGCILMNKTTLLDVIDKNNLQCTGCGACYNICPADAIQMVPDPLGFVQPEIDTSRCISCCICERTCPVLNEEISNGTLKPNCYAVQANDELRKISSSGGVFSRLAEYFITSGGVVFGAAWDSNLAVRHMRVDNLDDLAVLRKSKYVQSDTHFVYREVQELLKQGRTVLFSGTPCQVAALNHFLGNPSEHLFTVDILCHGVPSAKMLKDYLTESQSNSIASVDFRPMCKGWHQSAECMELTYVDGKKEIIPRKMNPYEEGFHVMLTLRESCYNCRFAEFPRQGDLSLGDFWGICDHDSTLDDNLGTSVVLANTEKGTALLQAASFSKIVQTPLEWLKYNRIYAKIERNPSQKYFQFLYPKIGFTAAVKDALVYRTTIGIVGPWMNTNCGGALTYYGLYETLVDMGYFPIMISQPEGLTWSPDPQYCRYIHNPYPDYALAPIKRDYAAQREINDSCETFIVGSDQLFTGEMLHLLDGYADLQWVDSSKRKIAYAASFAYDQFNGSESQKKELRYFLRQFDAFSVREASGVDLVKREFDVNAQWVLDPVFLCPMSKWETMADRGMGRVLGEKYVFGYILDPDQKKQEMMLTASQHLQSSCLAATDIWNEPDAVAQMWSIETLDHLANEELLAQIRNSQFVLTDSFHGVCFSIIFEKPFAVILNRDRGETRFHSLLGLLGLEKRIVSDASALSTQVDLYQPIDNNARALLQKYCDSSRTWLHSALHCEISPSLPQDASYEMACSYSDRSIRMLEKRLKFTDDGLNGRIDWLISHVDKVDGKQWEQLEDHRSRLDGMDARFKEASDTDEQQWHQLEDHRSRLDGIDARIKEASDSDERKRLLLEDHRLRLDGIDARFAEMADKIKMLEVRIEELENETFFDHIKRRKKERFGK